MLSIRSYRCCVFHENTQWLPQLLEHLALQLFKLNRDRGIWTEANTLYQF